MPAPLLAEPCVHQHLCSRHAALTGSQGSPGRGVKQVEAWLPLLPQRKQCGPVITVWGLVNGCYTRTKGCGCTHCHV